MGALLKLTATARADEIVPPADLRQRRLLRCLSRRQLRSRRSLLRPLLQYALTTLPSTRQEKDVDHQRQDQKRSGQDLRGTNQEIRSPAYSKHHPHRPA